MADATPPAARGLRAELGEHVRLAVPLAVASLGNQFLHLVDVAMLGRFSDEALAGAGIGGGVLFAFTVVGMGMVMGLDTLIPQALGAGDPARARHLLRQGLRACLLVGAPLTLLVALSPRLLSIAGVAEGTAAETEIYILGRLPGVVPLLALTAIRSYLQANHVTRPIVLSMIAANVLNVGANWALIFGDPGLARLGLPGVGLPPLGALGAALASTLVLLLSLAICAAWVRRVRVADSPARPAEPARGDRRRAADWATIGAILRLGLPVGFHLGLEVGIFALAAVLAGRLGTQPAAAHNVAVTLASFAFGAVLGMGAATSVRVGRAVGARDRAGARRAGALGLGVGALYTCVSAAVFVLLAEPLARLFSDQPEVVATAAPLVQIAAVFQLSDGAQAIAAGALRGVGDNRSTMWANLFGHYAVGLSAAIGLGFIAGWGARGIWWGLCLGLTTVAAILIARFRWLTARPLAPTQ